MESSTRPDVLLSQSTNLVSRKIPAEKTMEMMQKFRSTEESGVSMASRTFILLLTSLPTLQSALILIFWRLVGRQKK
jgi:hypothetical protein